jgi:hypothetical protein
MQATKDYAIEVATTALNSFSKQARGDLEAPNGDENVKLFTARGGSALTLGSTTTSAVVVFDPEASLRNGQLNVGVIERDASDVVTGHRAVNLGRPATDFISAGVLSSGMKVFNSSGVDVIGGTQTAAVLTSVPRDISTLTSTDIANFCSNHERDLASGIVSREDATMTLALTEHFGKKMCLSRANTLTNVVRREWDDAIGTRKTTAGQSLSYVTDTTLTVGVDISVAQSVTTTATHVMDSDFLDAANNPLTLATYSAEASGWVSLSNPGATHTYYFAKFRILALDHDDNVLAYNEIKDVTPVVNGVDFDLRFSGRVTSSTLPIARVVVSMSQALPDVTELVKTDSAFKLTAYEETADISARPVHVCVFEGLNASATLNINTTAVLTGVPDSTNVFISSSSDPAPQVADTNAVEMFMKSVARVLPRAFTVGGHGQVVKDITALYGTEEVEIAFKAMSFDKVASAVKRVGQRAKKTMRDVAEPLEMIGDVASNLPGPYGSAGRALATGSRFMRSM